MQIRIAIADDHPMVIDGLQKMLSDYSHIMLIGTYLNGTELLIGLEKAIPDVLILDIQLPGQTGDELAPIILKKYPNLNILTLTNFDSALHVSNMFRNGVLGYLLKTTDKETLVEAIETVNRGEEFIEPSMKEKVHKLSLKVKRSPSIKSNLTTREKEIIQHIVNGDTDAEISEKLFLSLNTIKHYRKCILLKMDAKNTATLVTKALKLGLAE